MNNKSRFFISICIIMLSMPLFSYEKELVFRDNAASYISQVTRSITAQFIQSDNYKLIKDKSIIITPMVSSEEYKITLPITRRIDENLAYEMSKKGFVIVDTNAMKILGVKDINATYIVVSSFTKYRYEMVINSRVVDVKNGKILGVAQVKVPRKILKEVERLYKKNSWFSETKE